jgi:excisionase family DNA binding protein
VQSFLSSDHSDIPNSSQDDELLTVKDVARRLKVDETTVRRWIKLGTLDYVTLPKTRNMRAQYRIKKSDVDKILESHRE